jgi:hypothetical protein
MQVVFITPVASNACTKNNSESLACLEFLKNSLPAFVP